MDALELVATWLHAVDQTDWQTVWECHAPESLILAGPQVIPRHNVDPALFVEYQQAVAAQTDAGRRWRFRPVGQDLVPVPDGVVVTVQLAETVSGLTFTAAFVVSRSGILGIAVDLPDPARAMAEALGDLAQVPAPSDWSQMSLTALHHGFERRHIGLQAALRALPSARFTCRSRGECCHVGKWGARISDNEWQAASHLAAALGLPALALKTPAEPPAFPSPVALDLRHCLAGGATTACTALGEDRRCQVHAGLGWQPIPVCSTYPIIGIWTPDGIDVTAYFSCRTVCENDGAPLHEQSDDFRARFWPMQHRLPRIPPTLTVVSGHAETLPWADYRQLEAALLDVLARLPTAGPGVLSEGTALMAGMQVRHVTGDITLDGLLMPILGDKPADVLWKGGWMGGRARQAWTLVRSQFVRFQSDHAMISRYLQSVYFRKPGLPESGIGFAWGTTLLAYRMIVEDARFRAWRAGRSETLPEDVLSAIRATEALVGHAGLSGALGELPDHPLESPDVWAVILQGLDRK